MTSDMKVKHKEESKDTSALDKQIPAHKKTFWQHPYFFHHLVINLCITLSIFGLVIIWLPYVGNKLEKWVFPSSHLIPKIQQEWTILNSKIESLTDISKTYKENFNELDTLKNKVQELFETVKHLSANIEDMNNQIHSLNKPVTQNSTSPNSLHYLYNEWQKVFTQWKNSEPFTKHLKDFLSLADFEKFLDDSKRQELSNFLNAFPKTFLNLQQDLQHIYDNLESVINNSVSSLNDINKSWWENLKEKVLTLVHIQRIDQPPLNAKFEEINLQYLKEVIEKVSKLLEDKHLKAAFNEIQKLPEKSRTLFNDWLKEAEKSKNFDTFVEQIMANLKSQLSIKG